jgi:hypothetical protein
MARKGESKGGTSVKVTLGKEIDAALGDVLRGFRSHVRWISALIFGVFEQMSKLVAHFQQAADRSSSVPARLFSKGSFGGQLQLEVRLTSFGRRLAEACGVI